MTDDSQEKKPERQQGLGKPPDAERVYIQKMEVPFHVSDRVFWRRTSVFQFVYSSLGLLLGLACIVGGIILFLHGVTGSTSWTAKFIGAESNVSDAPPGVVLFIVGLFVVWITRFSVKVRK